MSGDPVSFPRFGLVGARWIAIGQTALVGPYLVFVLGTYLVNGLFSIPLAELPVGHDPKDLLPNTALLPLHGVAMFVALVGWIPSGLLAVAGAAALVRGWAGLATGRRTWLLAVTVAGVAFFAISVTPIGAALRAWMLD